MKKPSIISGKYIPILSGVLVFFGLYLTSLYNYLLFHSLAELFSVVVACGLFMVAWNARRFVQNSYFLFVGIAYLFIGGMDLLHTLAYTGMGVFQGYDTNPPTQLWIAARYVEGLSLLIAPLLLGRRLNVHVVFLGYAVVISLLLGSIFYWEIFPVCFADGVGLTPFKKISEYMISLMLLASIFLLAQRRREFDRGVLQRLVASIILTISSELAFTLYVHAYGLPNLVGHFLKIVSFYLIYRALIQTGLVEPYHLLFRNLKQSEENFKRTFDQSPIGAAMVSLDYRFQRVNAEFCRITGYAEEELTSLGFQDVIHPDDLERCLKQTQRLVAGEIDHFQQDKRYIHKEGDIVWVRLSVCLIKDAVGRPLYLLPMIEDITRHKQAEETLHVSHRFFKIANQHTEMMPLLEAFMAEVKSFTACTAVGIRIRDENGRIPYQVYEGFSQSFYESESPLSIHSDRCMCIYVIQGDTDPKRPFYTEGGSFYVNSTTRFLATASEEEKEQTRNVCNQFGYESVALVPIRLGDRLLGLIHVADPRENRAPLEMVEVLEVVAMQLGTAIQRILAEGALRESLESWNERLREEVERKTQALRESQQFLQSVMDSIPDMIKIIDEEYRILYVNQVGEQMVGKPVKDLVGGICYREFRGQTQPCSFCPTPDTFQTGKAGQTSYQFTDAEGEQHVVELSTFPIYDEADRVTRVIEISRDVTERKRLEDEVLHKQKLASVGSLAAGVAHEIRNPLSSIITATRLLSAGDSAIPLEDRRALIEVLQDESKRLNNLLTDFLRFARPRPPKREPHPINDVVEEVLTMLQRDEQVNDKIHIQEELTSDMVPIPFDRDQIKQVLWNIALNAIQAMPEGGTLSVCSKMDEKEVSVVVQDTGEGIPEEVLERIFEPFYTLKKNGSGLGLAIVQQIVDAHRGRLSVQSQVGQGTVVEIYLPCS